MTATQNEDVKEKKTAAKKTVAKKSTEKKTTQKTTKKTTRRTTQTTKASGSKQEYIEYAREYSSYNTTEMECLINLWNRESGWNANAYNKSSGACGIPQALPCSKIKNTNAPVAISKNFFFLNK